MNQENISSTAGHVFAKLMEGGGGEAGEVDGKQTDSTSTHHYFILALFSVFSGQRCLPVLLREVKFAHLKLVSLYGGQLYLQQFRPLPPLLAQGSLCDLLVGGERSGGWRATAL